LTLSKRIFEFASMSITLGIIFFGLPLRAPVELPGREPMGEIARNRVVKQARTLGDSWVA